MKVDPTTWCSPENQAAQYLADTLNKIGDEKLVQKVSVYFHRFNVRAKALHELKKGMRFFYLTLLLNKTKTEIGFNVNNEKVKSLMLNIITAFYRKELFKTCCESHSNQDILQELNEVNKNLDNYFEGDNDEQFGEEYYKKLMNKRNELEEKIKLKQEVILYKTIVDIQKKIKSPNGFRVSDINKLCDNAKKFIKIKS